MSDDFHDTPPIHRIIYRDLLIEIYLEKRGGDCCGLTYQPVDKLCINCGEPLKPREVYTIAINGTPISGFEKDDEAGAIDLATNWVDHILEYTEGLQDNFDDDDEDEDESCEDCDNCDCEDDEGDKLPIDLADPPKIDKPADDGWGDPRTADTIRQMEKLKWFDKAAAIANSKPDKPLKKK